MKKAMIISVFLLIGILTAIPRDCNAQSTGQNAALESIGFFGDWSIYNSFVIIGSINDGIVVDVWEKKLAKDILNEQVGFIDNSKKNWDNLLNSSFISKTSDSLYIRSLYEIYDELKSEAQNLVYYIDNPTEDNHKKYRDCRQKAWDLIKVAFNINEVVQLQMGVGKDIHLDVKVVEID